jgi:hypothetical protein
MTTTKGGGFALLHLEGAILLLRPNMTRRASKSDMMGVL